jgi:hypothetical protein
VIGTCRHFAVLACALLRYRGIAARARCGFATYFQRGQGVDHWITEYWHDREERWVRVDPEILGQQVLQRPQDLAAGQFLTGGEAWAAFRSGQIDAAWFGVYGTANWGPAEIRGNAVRDLAALNKVETLPWDEWGRMHASYVVRSRRSSRHRAAVQLRRPARAARDSPLTQPLASLFPAGRRPHVGRSPEGMPLGPVRLTAQPQQLSGRATGRR